MADITLRILGQEPLPLNLGSDNSETLSVGSGVTEGRLQEVLTDYVPKSDIDTTLSISGDVAEAKATGDAIAEINAKLSDILPSDSASGAIASFPDGAKDFPLKSLSVDIEPVQDLHGLSAPYPAGGGANKYCPVSFTQKVENGITMTYNSDGTISLNGTSTGRVYQYITPYSQPYAPSGKTLTFRMAGIPDTASATFLNFSYSNDGKYYAGSYGTMTGNRDKTIVTEHEYNSVLLDIPAGQTFNNNKIYISATEGSTAQDWTPYSNICPISGWNETNVVRCGINVWDEELEQGEINVNTGVPFLSTSYSRSKNYTRIIPTVSYYCKAEYGVYVLFYDANKNYIGYIGSSQKNKEFTPANATNALSGGGSFANAVYMKFRYDNSGASYNDDLSFNHPSTYTDYVPYNGITKTISLGSTIYGGILNVDSGVLTVTKHYYSPDNTVTASLSSQTDTVAVMDIPLATNGQPYGVAGNIISNQFSTEITTGNAGRMVLNNQHIYIVIAKSQMASYDQDGLRTWLSNNPTTFIYELSTPITIPLTPTEIKTLLGNNNIFADSGDVAVVYSADIAKYIDKRLGA